jgi:hypothetical protein
MEDPGRSKLQAEQADALLRWSSDEDAGARSPPVPDLACFYGLVGEVAREGSEGTETSPIAIAGNFISYLSCAIGRMPHLAVGNTSHHARLFCLHVGRSGRGRKGDAVALVSRIDEALRASCKGLSPQVHRGGLSSREGLAALIHDGYSMGRRQVPAVEDKRLWVIESEFANVLQQSRRGGNTLSAALRDCWDGVDLKPATKTNCVHATRPHVCLSGAISPSELLALTQRRDLLNGFVNRFLMVWGERTQIAPFPRRTPQTRVDALAADVADILEFTRPRAGDGRESALMSMAEHARRRYAQLYRSELNQAAGNALVDSLLERRAPMLLRLAMVFALADRQWLIAEQHIDAAAAWVRYVTDSALFVFSSERDCGLQPRVQWAAERISEFLTNRGSASRRDLMVECFGRHQPAGVVDAAIAYLIDSRPSRVSVELQPRDHNRPGRPSTIYRLANSAATN